MIVFFFYIFYFMVFIFTIEVYMSNFKSIVMLAILAVFSGSIFSQDMPEIDPETAEIMKNYQNQSENMPSEVKALIPASVKITDQNFAVEATTNMLLTSSLRANNWESGSKVQLEYDTFSLVTFFFLKRK